jgi:DNA-binding response OmpR family regulator
VKDLGSLTASEVIEVGMIRVDPRVRSVWAGGGRVPLTAAEYAVLVRLAGTPGVVRSRAELMTLLGYVEPSPLNRTLDVHISRLRRKLGAAGKQIMTVRGEGYLLLQGDPAAA